MDQLLLGTKIIGDIIIDVTKVASIITDAMYELSLKLYITYVNTIKNFVNITPAQLSIIKKLYLDILKNSKQTIINMVDIYGNSITILIPPNGTLLPFFNYIEPSVLETFANSDSRLYKLYKTDNSDLPLNYNLTKNFNTTPVLHQGSCGTCWAYSFVSSISDAFLVTGLAQTNPLLSVTYVLSVTPSFNDKNEKISNYSVCDSESEGVGGWPTNIFKYIKNGMHNAYCNNNYNRDLSTSLIQNIIQKPIDPCPSNNNSSLYFGTKYMNVYNGGNDNDADIANPETFLPKSAENGFYTKLKLLDLQNMIKRHIMTIGPVICCLGITKTFELSGLYPIDGIYIYLEDYSYTPSNPSHNNMGNSDWIGGHAMTIVGWEIINVIGRTIPSWIIRNSWGKDWGDNGYIYLPMYPYNKDVQVECWNNNSLLYASCCCFYDVDSIKFDTSNPYPNITCNMLGYTNIDECDSTTKKLLPFIPSATTNSTITTITITNTLNFFQKFRKQMIIISIIIIIGIILYILL